MHIDKVQYVLLPSSPSTTFSSQYITSSILFPILFPIVALQTPKENPGTLRPYFAVQLGVYSRQEAVALVDTISFPGIPQHTTRDVITWRTYSSETINCHLSATQCPHLSSIAITAAATLHRFCRRSGGLAPAAETLFPKKRCAKPVAARAFQGSGTALVYEYTLHRPRRFIATKTTTTMRKTVS